MKKWAKRYSCFGYVYAGNSRREREREEERREDG
jgi:hypothetical protein